MYSLLKYVAFLLCLINISYCWTMKDSRLQSSRSSDDTYVGEFMSGACTKETRNGVTSQLQAIKCKPRPTLVSVKSSDPSIVMHPQAIVVNRCQGHCMNQRSCVALSSRQVNSTAIWFDPHSRSQICGEVEVAEHLSCGCKCTTLSEDCNSKQEYMKSMCMCMCTNQQEMHACIKQKRVWNREMCQCECPQMELCSTGYEWIPKLCGCGRVTEMQGEDNKNSVDSDYKDSEEDTFEEKNNN